MKNERAYIAFRRDLTDEMAYIEREAREQAEADYHDELTDIRLQLATVHEAIGEALALLRQQSYGTAAIVLEDALKGKK